VVTTMSRSGSNDATSSILSAGAGGE
jgi:hypothetical protein